jgi:hypothetical protein
MRIAGFRAEMWIRDLPHSKQRNYPVSRDIWFFRNVVVLPTSAWDLWVGQHP